MGLFNIEERFNKVFEILENIDERAQETLFTAEVYSYIKWREAYELCSHLEENGFDDNNYELKKKIDFVKKKFKEIAPQIIKYRYKLRDSDKKTVHYYFKEVIFKYLDIADNSLQDVPAKSYEIYLDLMRFVEFFDLSLPNLVEAAKNTINNKLLLVYHLFEKEKAEENMYTAQFSLSSKLKNALGDKKAVEVGVAPSISEDGEGTNAVLEDYGIDKSEVSVEDSSDLIGGPSLPEEEEGEVITYDEFSTARNMIESAMGTNTTAQTESVTPADHGTRAEEAGRMGTEPQVPQMLYSYWNWYPSEIVPFMQLRYCLECGRILQDNGVCPSCGARF